MLSLRGLSFDIQRYSKKLTTFRFWTLSLISCFRHKAMFKRNREDDKGKKWKTEVENRYIFSQWVSLSVRSMFYISHFDWQKMASWKLNWTAICCHWLIALITTGLKPKPKISKRNIKKRQSNKIFIKQDCYHGDVFHFFFVSQISYFLYALRLGHWILLVYYRLTMTVSSRPGHTGFISSM